MPWLEERDFDVMATSPVFRGVVCDESLAQLLESMGAIVRSWCEGAAIRRAGDELDFYPVVLTGEVRATMLQGGEWREVARFSPGDSFAEAVPAAIRRCPVDIWAVKDVRVLAVPAGGLSASADARATAMRDNLAREMSKKVAVLSRSLMVLGEPRLSDRILAYLRTLPRRSDDSVFVPLSRKEWASYLRVGDKSLIRELRNMQEAGVLSVDGRRIVVLGDDRPVCPAPPDACGPCLKGLV